MAQEPLPEYGAYKTIISALSPLTPEQRVMVMDWAHECYCKDCGFPAPPSGEECATCKPFVSR